MSKRKQPKFKAGDTVVVTIYGTVGKVTNIKLLEGEYVYEVNESEGLFKEDCLRLLYEYDGYLLEQEQIDIEYRFLFGDLVRVKGYDNDLFKVVGFRTEIWRYKEDAWEDVIYELTRIHDGEWLEADEDELTLIADYDQAETYIKKYGIVTPVKHDKALLPSPRYQDDSIVDRLLDHYNDYKTLYYLFNDKKYKRKMNSIVDQLKNHLNSNSDVT
ncbi:hypothetical protein FZC84_02935 [Rossellomorea vietnamensis]|uniref:YodN n=1 Tax=Rossellomorea vietnamensis TaxID=218284 RepID=A0A5D4MI73_9BACI|nr:hypothetical protein [Rossellomorea vietnamensis]TYS01615.1 hypothetical protein FZC84_02935 [Rossellomorea vietnamensis]